MFDHLLESSRWDDSNKWSNIGFGKEIGIVAIKTSFLSGALTYILWDVCKILWEKKKLLEITVLGHAIKWVSVALCQLFHSSPDKYAAIVHMHRCEQILSLSNPGLIGIL